MRKVLMLIVAATLFTGCKKEKKDEAATTGSAAGSAEVGSAGATAATPTEGSAAMPDPATGAKTVDPTAGSADAPVARPATVTDAHVAVADKMIKVFNEFGDALKTAGTDCKAATAATKSFVPKFKELGTQADQMKEIDKDPEAKKWFEATYAPKMMAAMGPMMETAQACQADKDFQAAMQSMQEAMPKDN